TDEQRAMDVLNARETTVVAHIARICKALAAEIDLPRDVCHAVELRRQKKGSPKVFLHYLHELRHKTPPHLLIDASADLDINRRLFGEELRELRLDVERRALVVQTRGRDFGNQSLTGKMKNDVPHYPEQAKHLRDEVARVCRFLGMELVVANKSAEKALT